MKVTREAKDIDAIVKVLQDLIDGYRGALKMNNDIYRAFVGCFNEIGELQVSDEEFAEKSAMLNRWMITLDEETRTSCGRSKSIYY